MKQAAIIWAVALCVAILGVFYINWCIDSARSGFERTEAVGASSFPASMYYDVKLDRVVGVESYQGSEDNTGYRLQPAQVRSLEYQQ